MLNLSENPRWTGQLWISVCLPCRWVESHIFQFPASDRQNIRLMDIREEPLVRTDGTNRAAADKARGPDGGNSSESSVCDAGTAGTLRRRGRLAAELQVNPEGAL